MHDVEDYISLDRGLRFETAFRGYEPGNRLFRFDAMPDDLEQFLRAVARVEPVGFADVDAREFDDLWASMQLAFDALGLEDDFGPISEWTGHDLTGAIIEVIAEGMTYVWLPLRSLLTATGSSAIEGGTRNRILSFEMFFMSLLKALTLDTRCPVSVARRPVQGELSGLCRHYASVARVLFFAAQQATGRWKNWELLVCSGTVNYSSGIDHAWNWLCDFDRNVVYTFDISAADYELDQGREETVFNPKLDGTRHCNRTAFFGTLFRLYAHETDAELCRLLEHLAMSLLEPETFDGQHLLWNLAHQNIVGSEVRDGIYEWLVERELFEMPVREEFAQPTGLGSLSSFEDRKLAFFEFMMGRRKNPNTGTSRTERSEAYPKDQSRTFSEAQIGSASALRPSPFQAANPPCGRNGPGLTRVAGTQG